MIFSVVDTDMYFNCYDQVDDEDDAVDDDDEEDEVVLPVDDDDDDVISHPWQVLWQVK